MKELYHIEGTVNRGFVGQITYTVCLEQALDTLDIHFSFDADKQRYCLEEITSELLLDTIETCRQNYDLDITETRAREIILGDMKTEIHTLATLNDEFIGCIHKQLTDRHMLYDHGTASDGCIPQEKIDGVLKVTVLVFNVIKDDTHYKLTVSGQ